MNVRRTMLVPLLVIFSMLVIACSTPGTTGTPTNGTDGSPAAADSPAADSPAAEGSPAVDGSPATDQASGDAINMQIAWWGSQDRHDRTIEVLNMFMEEHPNVNLTWEYAPFSDYWTRLTTQAAGGNLPCLIQQDYAYLGEWVDRGQLMPLDQFVEDGTIDTSNIDEAYLAGGRLNGQLYAISLGTNSLSLVYDPAMFEQAGLEYPGPDWTWDEFEQVMSQLHEQLDTYGMSVGLTDLSALSLWLKQHGQTLYNEEGTALGYEDDQLFVDYFTMLKDWMDQGLIPTREFEVSQGSVGIEDNIIVRQEAPMAYMWSNQIVAVTSAAGRPLEAGLLPKPNVANAELGQYLKPSMFWSITANCPEDQAQVAAEIINFFTNDLEANDVLLAERGVPISSEVRQYLQPKLEAAQQEAFEVVSLVEEQGSPLDPADPPGHTEIVSEVYVPLMDQMLYGQISPEEAATQFREQANAILSQNQ